MIIIRGDFQIPFHEIELTFSRSSGPGGQNVNKVNSKALLRWNAFESPALLNQHPELRDRVLQSLRPKLSQDGDLLVVSDKYRDQIRNKDDCLQKFAAILIKASERPKHRKKTKPTRTSREKRMTTKSKLSEKKAYRRTSRQSDDD